VRRYYCIAAVLSNTRKRPFKIGLVVATIASLAQLVSATVPPRRVQEPTREVRPRLEGVYKTEPYSPLYLVGWVDTEMKRSTASRFRAR